MALVRCCANQSARVASHEKRNLHRAALGPDMIGAVTRGENRDAWVTCPLWGKICSTVAVTCAQWQQDSRMREREARAWLGAPPRCDCFRFPRTKGLQRARCSMVSSKCLVSGAHSSMPAQRCSCAHGDERQVRK